MAMSTKRGDPRLSRAYRKARLACLQMAGYVCVYCGQDATTADHVIPIKAGGDPVDQSNLVASCVACNSKKGSRNQGSFLGSMRTPPVFSSNISPMKSRTMPDSPFTARPVTDSPD
jgi:5-methylcytosine-specific restriction endonuclease McrA